MDWGIIWKYAPVLFEGFKITLLLWVAGTVLAMLFAGVLVIGSRSRYKAIVFMVRLYTEFILGIPVLVLLYVVYFVLPKFGLLIPAVPAGLLTLTLYHSPYMAEVVRGAINAVPVGQIEAGRAIGMSGAQVAWRIIIPQALGVAIPPMTGQCIGVAKDTAILSLISVQELTFQTRQVVSRTYAPLETWFIVVVFYYAVLTVFEHAMRFLERRVTRYRRSTDSARGGEAR
jgi:polar amino acid transport system permease protein